MEQFYKEYIVTIKDRADLEQFYLDMASESGTDYIPSRVVECVAQRPISRNTHYKLTYQEAATLAKDPRIAAVTLHYTEKKLSVTSYATQSGTWSRSSSAASEQKNWGLARSTKSSNIPGWGSDTGTTDQTSSITLNTTGKNVDVVIVDQIAYPTHAEFGGRLTQYDWFSNHNAAVWPTNPNSTYAYDSYTGANNHATHVAGIIGGSTQGWAKEANLYNIRHDWSATVNSGDYTPLNYVFDYIREFHNSKTTNPETGVKNPTIVNNSWGLSLIVYAANNGNTGNNRYSKINYRGNLISAEDLGNTPVDTGYTGVCNSNTRIATLNTAPGSGNRITTVDNITGSTSSISYIEQGRTGLTDQGLPTVSDGNGIDSYDDAYWTVALPFSITYLGVSYSTVYVGSNGYVTFGTGSGAYLVSASSPGGNKIHVSAGDRNCRAVWAGTKGITGDRTFVIRWEGVEGPWLLNDDPTPTTIWEMTFYENPTNRIDLHVVSNAAYRGEFTSAQLEDYGILQNGGVAPQRDAALDADIADCIADGIIFVGSAGNSGFKIDTESLSSTADYNNYFVDYDNGDILEPTYYHRGSSPSVSETSICVGNLGSLTNEGRNARSNAGPRVDLYAPGTNIASAVYDNTGTSGTDWSSQPVNESGQLYQKYTGSSMSAAQVTGYLALVLENHPDMTHDEAKQYLLQNARDGQMYDSNSSAFSDTSSLLGGNNKILYARQDRETDGAVYPTSLEWLRPATGNVFPRPKIKRS